MIGRERQLNRRPGLDSRSTAGKVKVGKLMPELEYIRRRGYLVSTAWIAWLATERAGRGWSQDALAMMLDERGVAFHRGQVSHLEAGRTHHVERVVVDALRAIFAAGPT